MHGRTLVLAACTLAALATPARGRAFCGFYVGSAEESLHNDASMVVVMREGQRTVLAMRNDYEGPSEEFAMIVPVPAPIAAESVRTLDPAVFEKLERLTAPRLVEYEQAAPICPPPGFRARSTGVPRIRAGSAHVQVEAEFPVGEYDVVVLSAGDSSALDAWIRAHGYHIPEGAEPFLRPYVGAGWRFVVARVDVTRIAMSDGHARLSPLRIHYDADDLRIPVRLGLLNSAGVQDLVVVVVSREGRFEVASYPNVTIPTNLEVRDETRHGFAAFYDALFARTQRDHPGSVVTEYAWDANQCDPCPGPALDGNDVTMLGGDVLPSARETFGNPPNVFIDRPARVSGRGHADTAVLARLEQARPMFAACPAARVSPGGAVLRELHLEMELTSAGRIVDIDAGGGRLGACVERALRNGRVTGPPIGIGASRWRARVRWLSSVRYAQPWADGFTITRLHYRYGPVALGEDLVLRAAPPLEGGTGMPSPDGTLDARTHVDARMNRFQARYAILHRWDEPIACEHPLGGRWSAPSGTRAEAAIDPLGGSASAATALERFLLSPISAHGTPRAR